MSDQIAVASFRETRLWGDHQAALPAGVPTEELGLRRQAMSALCTGALVI